MHRTYVDLPHSPHTMVTNKTADAHQCTPWSKVPGMPIPLQEYSSLGTAPPDDQSGPERYEICSKLGTVAASLPAKRSGMLKAMTGS